MSNVSVQIDARGARFSALITAIVFSAALLTQAPALIVYKEKSRIQANSVRLL